MALYSDDTWKTIYLRQQGNEFRTQRLARNLSIQELSKILGIHRNTLTAIEWGRHDYLSLIGGNIYASLGARVVYVTQFTDILELSQDRCFLEQTKDILRMPQANQIYSMGQQIRLFRKAHGLTMNVVAYRCQLHPNSIWNIEQGLVVPTMFTLHRIYYSMGVKKITASFNSLLLYD